MDTYIVNLDDIIKLRRLFIQNGVRMQRKQKGVYALYDVRHYESEIAFIFGRCISFAEIVISRFNPCPPMELLKIKNQKPGIKFKLDFAPYSATSCYWLGFHNLRDDKSDLWGFISNSTIID